jgi:hypothetical protein
VTDSSDAEKRFLPHLWWGFFCPSKPRTFKGFEAASVPAVLAATVDSAA